jgi:hypothetical protein
MSALAIQEPIQKKFNDNIIELYPNKDHEFVMDSDQVSKGFDCSKSTIWNHRKEHSDELKEGKHFYYSTLRNTEARNLQTKKLFWTKRGIIRLGFFIRSERAKQFRDWAEDLILDHMEQKTNPEPKRKVLGKPLEINKDDLLIQKARELPSYDLRRIEDICRMFPAFLFYGAIYSQVHPIRTKKGDLYPEDEIVNTFRRALREVSLPK